MKFVLEPTVFALDDRVITEAEFNKYVSNLVQWYDWINRFPEDIYTLSYTEALLFKLNYYPVFSSFESLMKKFSIDYVQAQDLNKFISLILRHAKPIDGKDIKHISDEAIVEEVSVKETRDSLSSEMKESFNSILWYIFIRSIALGEDPGSYLVFGNDLKGDTSFVVKYHILSGEDLIEKKESATISSFSDLYSFIKDPKMPSKILSLTTNKSDMDLAIKISISQSNTTEEPHLDIFDSHHYIIQDSFIDDFNNSHYKSNPSIINSIVNAMNHTLLNLNMSKREDFRTGKGGNNPQLCHGEFCAWRRYVTTSIKMQYWQKDSLIKFANIKEHDMFECQWEE